MPAHLVLLNPSNPPTAARARAKRVMQSKPKTRAAPSAKQLAARARFAAMAKQAAAKRRAGGAAYKNPAPKDRAVPATRAAPSAKQLAARARFTAMAKRRAAMSAGMRRNPLDAPRNTRAEARTAYSMMEERSPVAKKAKAKKAKAKAKKAAPAAPAAPKKAAKKATKKAPKKAAKKAAKKAPKKAARRAKRPKHPLRAKAHDLRKRATKLSKAGSKTTAGILRTRARALSYRAGLEKPRRKNKKGAWVGYSSAQRAMLKQHGLLKVNASVGSVVKDMFGLLPQAGVTVASFAGMAMLGSKVQAQLVKQASLASVAGNKHFPAAVSFGTGALSYVIARLIGSKAGGAASAINRAAPSLFVGGVLAAAVHTIAAMKQGAKLGLPIAGLGEYVVGEYVVGSRIIDVNGTPIAVDGRHMLGMGEYVPFTGQPDALDLRESDRGTASEQSAAEILDRYDGLYPVAGNLTGSIFDG